MPHTHERPTSRLILAVGLELNLYFCFLLNSAPTPDGNSCALHSDGRQHRCLGCGRHKKRIYRKQLGIRKQVFR